MEIAAREFESKNNDILRHLHELQEIILKVGVVLEGNCFYYHQSLNLFPELLAKQVNLFACGRYATSRICEIGFNAGHSSMLLLLGRENTPIDFTVFDIGHYSYTKPCMEYIKSQFSHANFEYIEGDSTVTMPEFISKHNELMGTYDVIHVDGGHTEHCISNDMRNTDLLIRVGGIVIIDDTNDYDINRYVDMYISTGNYEEKQIFKTVGYPHRVIQKIR